MEDLSGVALTPGENPYAVLIDACNDNHKEIQRLYSDHRTRRNAQQREKFLAPDFGGLVIDQHLLRLERPSVEPGFRDERNCLVFWARPPTHVLRLASRLQDMLKQAAPNIWLMPTYSMHLTTLEVAFSKTPEEIASLLAPLRPALPRITSHTHSHRARLVKPYISYDQSAFAVSFRGDAYTYHHLRRDVWDLVRGAGVEVGSRYQVPSAHVTLGRYLGDADHDTPAKREAWVGAIDRVNEWLEHEVWDQAGADFVGEWVVGHEKGLDARNGTLWYGGGRTVVLGEGF
ncbi:hypothetical protein HIM_01018 [Hirsutella minnesotensis 3608]|nr:hypothetical protein HIM_01018 [Hirsutella minnesotensis 3608]